jgi:hypothetical protein
MLTGLDNSEQSEPLWGAALEMVLTGTGMSTLPREPCSQWGLGQSKDKLMVSVCYFYWAGVHLTQSWGLWEERSGLA